MANWCRHGVEFMGQGGRSGYFKDTKEGADGRVDTIVGERDSRKVVVSEHHAKSRDICLPRQ